MYIYIYIYIYILNIYFEQLERGITTVMDKIYETISSFRVK